LSDRVIELLFYHIRTLRPTQLLIPLVSQASDLSETFAS
jgi:hypothetical protein